MKWQTMNCRIFILKFVDRSHRSLHTNDTLCTNNLNQQNSLRQNHNFIKRIIHEVGTLEIQSWGLIRRGNFFWITKFYNISIWLKNWYTLISWEYFFLTDLPRSKKKKPSHRCIYHLFSLVCLHFNLEKV